MRRAGNSIARIDVSGDPAGGSGGTIDLEADGNMLVDGVLDAGANAADMDGGAVTLSGGAIVLGAASEIDLGAKGDGDGGVLTIDSDSNLTLGGHVDATGGLFDASSGSDIALSAVGNLTSSAKIELQATQGGGDGGTIEIDAGGRFGHARRLGRSRRRQRR